MNSETKKEAVRERYGEIARESSTCCSGGSSCCGGTDAVSISSQLGYTRDEMESVPSGANLGLGCGNPSALAGIKVGEEGLHSHAGHHPVCRIGLSNIPI